MSDRVFRKDNNALSTVNALGLGTAHWDSELLIRFPNYSSLSALEKVSVDTAFATFNYTFAYDD